MPDAKTDLKSPLYDLLRERIETEGPISVAEYMEMCLSHPEFGYYMVNDPLGRGGDFITAPEVSQMFGEIIGAYAACIMPEDAVLMELGPGRGTLMADALRANPKLRGFPIYLVETSPVLKKKQADSLCEYAVIWQGDLSVLPECPVIFIANEFFDALPIEQYVEGKRQSIDVRNGELLFALEGEVCEQSPAREAVMRQICYHIRKYGGAALIIDYGHLRSARGDTLQAMQGHRYVSVFHQPGLSDLTSHVDFEVLGKIALNEGLEVEVKTQGQFLKETGIDVRASQLIQGKSDEVQKRITGEVERLVAPDQMGDLFKVMGVS